MDITVKLIFSADGTKITGLVTEGGTLEQVEGPLKRLAETLCEPDLFSNAELVGKIEAHTHPHDRFKAQYRLRQ